MKHLLSILFLALCLLTACDNSGREEGKISTDLGAMMTAWSLWTRKRVACALGCAVLCSVPQTCLTLRPHELYVTHSNEDREG